MIKTANLTLSVSRKAGGLFESVRRLVQSLEQTGMNIRVFGIRDEFTEADLAAWAPAQVLAFQPTWPESFGYSPNFLEKLIAFQPDIIHAHGIWVYPSIATNHYCRKTRSPYLISAHGMLDRWAVENSRWKKTVAHFLYEGAHLRGAHCQRALCEAEARAIRELGLHNPIAVIPNGVDLPTADSTATAAKNSPWARLLAPGQKVLLYLGRIHPKKGLMNLLRAWAEIEKSKIENRKSDDWVLAIAGWDQGGHEQELQQLATELGIRWSDQRGRERHHLVNGSRPETGNLWFLGPLFGPDRAAAYHHCDGFILPSFSEGVPMTVLEAWVNSKPVLMTPPCNLPEGFAAGAALRMEPTTESVTAGLNEFLRMSAGDRAGMGGRGYALAADRFVWPRIASQMKELYTWMLGGGTRPASLTDF
jgi:poly(glycerol-phosphate) alpha-glucosyltransferase